jgi:hypothetical protein
MEKLEEHPLYDTWRGIVARCRRPDSPRYGDYGGRGIKLCCHWHNPVNFIADIEHEIGPRPVGQHPSGRPMYTLDRIDNDFGYQPGNVRWATAAQQAKNTRRCGFPPLVLVPLNGTQASYPDSLAASEDKLAAKDEDLPQRKPRSFRIRGDQWQDLGTAAKTLGAGGCTFAGWAIDVAIGHTRCERCHAAIPFEFGDLAGREMTEWVAGAIKEAAGQRCRAGHGPVFIGAKKGAA